MSGARSLLASWTALAVVVGAGHLPACTSDPAGDPDDGAALSGGAPGTGAVGDAGAPPAASSGGKAAHESGGGDGAGGTPLDDEPSERLEVEGGLYPMGRSDAGLDACPDEQSCAPGETPEHDVSVSTFWLDRYEVTVERFRAFYELYPLPELAEGAGAHPRILGSGWQSAFAADLPASQQALALHLSCADDASFTAEVGPHETWPINCVSWPLAFAFCAAVGGRLPTEAEWERAAAGGDDNRLYPWGQDDPDASRASFFPSALGPVGAREAGRGRYGHDDLAGSVWEWTLDWLDTNWYAAGGATCSDCARVSSGTHRAIRGGAYSFEAVTLRAAVRSGDDPSSVEASVGFRCAYDSDE